MPSLGGLASGSFHADPASHGRAYASADMKQPLGAKPAGSFLLLMPWIGQPKGPSSCGVISRVVTNGAGHADRGLRKIRSRIASPSTNRPRLSTAEPRAAMLVLHERKSRMTLAARLAGQTAAETISIMLAVFAWIEPALRKSITFDNDTVFAQHALLRTMRAMTTWFCDAYASWQKGGVENANARLRRWLPRQIGIDQVSDEEIQDIVTTSPPPISGPENAWASRPLSRRSSKSLAKTCKS
jgi:hypothetical protein